MTVPGQSVPLLMWVRGTTEPAPIPWHQMGLQDQSGHCLGIKVQVNVAERRLTQCPSAPIDQSSDAACSPHEACNTAQITASRSVGIHVDTGADSLAACLWQVHEGYIELVKGLLEKLTQDHTTSVSITASAFAPPSDADGESSGTAPSHLKSHADLRYAVALLLLAAEALPEQDVEFTVSRLLFNQARCITL